MKSPLLVLDSHCLLPLSQGYFAIIDVQDRRRVARYKWTAAVRSNTVYAYRRFRSGEQKRSIYLHRFVLGLHDSWMKVDHKNHNGLDNRRRNLRICTHQENHRNQRPRGGRSKYKGVTKGKGKGRWFASAVINYRQIPLGRYDTEEEAARAYDAFAKSHFGRYANLNFK